MSQVAHQAGAYPSFRSMKQLGVFLLPLDKILVHHTWVDRGTVRVKCLAQEHNMMSPTRA